MNQLLLFDLFKVVDNVYWMSDVKELLLYLCLVELAHLSTVHGTKCHWLIIDIYLSEQTCSGRILRFYQCVVNPKFYKTYASKYFPFIVVFTNYKVSFFSTG